MEMSNTTQRVTVAGLTTLIKVGLIGLLMAEAWRLGWMIAATLDVYINRSNSELDSLTIGLLILTLGLVYGYVRDCKTQLLQFIRSARIDLFIALLVGIVVSLIFDGLGTGWYSATLAYLTLPQLLVLIAIPPMTAILLVMRAIQTRYTDRIEKYAPFFISDVEKKNKSEDLLGFTDNAERFAERVFNGGSSDSIVFGIDAPWGIGKSTFVNLCQQYWNDRRRDQVIVYKFNPLRYEHQSNLLNKFVDGLVRVIQKEAFVPEIRPLISRYSRFVQAKGTITIPGLHLEVRPGSYTVDDAFEDLEAAFENLDKKIIIVVDDLDRLSFSAIKDVLFVIKKSFTLPNISYVLCYDTENIAALEKGHVDPDKITEFLEKFVNVKVSLYLDNETLANYVSENLAKSMSGNSQADPVLVSKAVGGLIDIFKSPEYHRYLPFIGDVRKLKRLLNTLMFLEVEQVDFDNSDFDKKDLIHLLLIYINYPNVFRKIYNTETAGKRGFFSLVIKYDPHYPQTDERNFQGSNRDENSYKNSTLYDGYIKELGSDSNPAFLLDQVFKAETRLEKTDIDNLSEEATRSYACFNGSWTNGRNLEAYLNLIVKLSKPQKGTQYRFYSRMKELIQQGTEIGAIVADNAEFSTIDTEANHELLWRVVVNSAHDFSAAVSKNLIGYLLEHMPRHSLLNLKDLGIGLRDDLDYFLITLLDKAGWSDSEGMHRNNSQENLVEIAEWVFGEGRHADHGVIETLSRPERGLLGLYDLMAFRLFCSADRGGNIFNLQRALSLHGSPTAPTQGDTRTIAVEELREMTQRVFGIFQEQYITPGRNIFALAEVLTLSEIAGNWASFVETQVAEGKITQAKVDSAIAALKSRITSFISYQLGNKEVSHGVGCGYYDETGTADGHGIAGATKDYLFNQCFNPDLDAKNYEHFVDYLLANFTGIFSSAVGPGLKYVPHINEFTKVLDRHRLANYWRANSTAIRALNLENRNKEIVTGNYIAFYAEDLLATFVVLDQLVAEAGIVPTTSVETDPAA